MDMGSYVWNINKGKVRIQRPGYSYYNDEYRILYETREVEKII